MLKRIVSVTKRFHLLEFSGFETQFIRVLMSIYRETSCPSEFKSHAHIKTRINLVSDKPRHCCNLGDQISEGSFLHGYIVKTVDSLAFG